MNYASSFLTTYITYYGLNHSFPRKNYKVSTMKLIPHSCCLLAVQIWNALRVWLIQTMAIVIDTCWRYKVNVKLRTVYHQKLTRSFRRRFGKGMGTYHKYYSDFIMGAILSPVTGVSIVCSTVCWYLRKHQSSASLAFVRGIRLWLVDSPHKRPATRQCFPFMTS